MNINVSLEGLIQIAAVVGAAWGLARRMSRLELKTDLMWKVFEKRLGVTREELEDD